MKSDMFSAMADQLDEESRKRVAEVVYVVLLTVAKQKGGFVVVADPECDGECAILSYGSTEMSTGLLEAALVAFEALQPAEGETIQ